MATIPSNSTEGKAPAKPPISQHPAFPAIVALWFAALLGLGSLVLPVVLLESIVTTTGISALVPAATPPLGVTARGMLALAATLSGAGLGLLLARHVAAAHRSEPRARIAGTIHRPLNARVDLGEEGLMSNGVKRRALAINDESAQSDFLNHAPLPGEDPWAPPASLPAMFDHVPQDDEPLFDTDHGPAFEPLDLDRFSQDADTYEPFDLALEAEAAPEADLHEDDFMSDKQEFRPLTLGQQEELQRQDFFARADPASFGRAVRPEVTAGPELDPVGETIAAEPLQFAAPSQARQEARPADAAWNDAPVAAVEFETANPEDLGMVQLVQRLGHSLEKRREQLALDAQKQQQAAAQPLPETAPTASQQAFEAARPEEAAQAMAAFFGKPAGVPGPRAAAPGFPAPEFTDPDFAAPQAAFAPPVETATDLPLHFTRSLAHLSTEATLAEEVDGEEDEYLPASFTLPLRNTLPVEDAAEDDEETEFGSLLSLNNPFVQHKEPAFVRIDEPDSADALPPAGGVVFPGQADNSSGPRTRSRPEAWPEAADPGVRMFDRPVGGAAPRKPTPEMDQALRSALSKLQRMSGAA